jgi:hypothetical protein
MNLEIILNKEIIYSLFLSFLVVCLNYLISFILISIDDRLLFFINNKIYIDKSELESDLELDSDLDSNNSSDLDTDSNSDIDLYYNEKNCNDEYKSILELFCIVNNSNNNNQLHKKPYINNILLNKNEIYIVNSFLFNFNKDAKIIDLLSIYPFTKKLIILYKYYKKLNTNYIMNLNLSYKYLYILYKNDTNEYNYLILDIFNNKNIFTNKKLLFNNIKL